MTPDDYTPDPTPRKYRCRDGFCGCQDCDRCFPGNRENEPETTNDEEGFAFATPGKPMAFRSIELRAMLEARGRARLRYAEADAMLAQRKEGGK